MYFKNDALANLLNNTDVVVFDLNGLIIDDEQLQKCVTEKAINDKLREVPTRTIVISDEQWTRLCVGCKPREFIPKLLAENGILADEVGIDIAQIITFKDSFYRASIGEHAKTIVRPGVTEFISFLAFQDKKIALATSTTQDGVLAILGEGGLNILNVFDLIVCGDQVTKSKPDPEIYLAVKSYFEVNSNFGVNSNYLVFEDAESGVRAACEAGMTCIAVPNQFTMGQEGLSSAAYIIGDLTRQAAPIYR